ncbi:hypothetical protein Pst134EB_016394 [Puccinia striiformis f. sp. tritici]|nr:hypothetical protein Pst134EB_016394 [Puccinia striiformis f. sp. tritici]
MEAVLDGLGMSTMLSGEKSRDAAGKFIADDPDLKIQAKALIAPLIHGSLISTVTANGGDKDIVKLWANIMSFGSSKKEANLFRAYRNLESIVINPNNLAGSILQYRDAIAELKSLDQSPDKRQTAHMILGKIPDSLASIRDAIISTGLSSTVVTYEVVLDMIDNKAKSQPVAPVQSKPTHSTHRAENGESDAATALLAEFCKNKTHDPNASHSAAQCFALHPELLDAYRARLKARKSENSPSSHFTAVVSPMVGLTSALSSVSLKQPDQDSDNDDNQSEMEAVLDGLGMSTMLSGEKSRDAAGKFIADDPDLKIQAKALIAPLIHGSLISTVTANGGDKDIVKLWANIMSFGSSKKEANLFRAYRNLESIVINPNNLAGSILQYRDAIAELKSLDQSPDKRQTAHMILGKIPDSLASIRDAIISTGLSSTVVTAENGESDAATALLAEFCKNKTHDPNASHSAAQCFALHPELLDAYRARLKARKSENSPSSHFTAVVSPMVGLTSALSSVSLKQPDQDSDNDDNQSEVSLL